MKRTMLNLLLALVAPSVLPQSTLSAAPPQSTLPIGYKAALAKATASGSFMATWVGDYAGGDVPAGVVNSVWRPYLDGDWPGYKTGDVVISGPWHGGRHVWYATLHRPTHQQIVQALAVAENTWRFEQSDKHPPLRGAAPVPFSPAAADGRQSAPVGATTEWRKGVTALDDVNRQRAAKGLPPYRYDEGLTRAAKAAAEARAAYLFDGHYPWGGDFQFLPKGCRADTAGCAAWDELACDAIGFGSCAIDDPTCTRAGAAWVRGRDGKRYMHLFVGR